MIIMHILDLLPSWEVMIKLSGLVYSVMWRNRARPTCRLLPLLYVLELNGS